MPTMRKKDKQLSLSSDEERSFRKNHTNKPKCMDARGYRKWLHSFKTNVVHQDHKMCKTLKEEVCDNFHLLNL